MRIPTVAGDSSIRTATRIRARSPHPFASPHAVRRILAGPLQSSAHFGCVFRCARSDYHRLMRPGSSVSWYFTDGLFRLFFRQVPPKSCIRRFRRAPPR